MPEQRFIIAVQGEGRGHLTQAIAIIHLLQEQGHEVCGVIAGTNPHKPLPDFFLKAISAPLLQVKSPHFTMNKKGSAIHMPATILHNLRRAGTYLDSLRKMRRFIEGHQPDILINLYEPLVALYTLSYFRNFEIIAIAHQYIYLHEDFHFPNGFTMQGAFLKYYTKFTAIGAKKIMALSMYTLPNHPKSKLQVSPPALRRNLLRRTPAVEPFMLVYIINTHFMAEIIQWHKQHPQVKLVCFTDNRDVKERYKGTYTIDENLVFHSLHQEKVLDLMARCSALVCTAGFESVCEALYFSKPVMLIPVEGHFEQYCNARDTARIGAGVYSKHFDFDPAVIQQLQQTLPGETYKVWVDQFPEDLKSVIAGMTRERVWKYESVNTTPSH
jgi:uncharacterized protein (TIGR00661 family)